MSFHKIIANIGHILLFLSVLLYLRRYFRYKESITKILAIYLSVSLIIQLISKILNIYVVNNLFLSHFYFVSQFVLLSFFFRMLFKSKYQKRLVDYALISVLLILGIHYSFYPELFYRFNLLEIVLTSLSLVSYSIIHFYNGLNREIDYIYINSGICIYLLSSTLIFCSGNFINASNSYLNKLLWGINATLYVLYLLLFVLEWYRKYTDERIQSKNRL